MRTPGSNCGNADLMDRDALRTERAKLSQDATLSDKTTLEERSQELENRIHLFHSKLDTMMEGLEHQDIGFQSNEVDDKDDEEDPNGRLMIKPEHMSIFMPSSVEYPDLQRLGLESMGSKELELRKGQANDALEGLRLALGHKALLYRNKVSN